MNEQEIISEIKKEAERRYPRKMSVLAKRMKWSRAKLSKILNGEQAARLQELIMLCSVLAVPLSSIIKTTGA